VSKTRIVLYLACICTAIAAPGAQSATIHITSASYGYGGNTINVLNKMREVCEGKTQCRGTLASLGFPDISPQNPKRLRVAYQCGPSNSDVAESADALIWRISCPPSRQPSYRVDYRIYHTSSCQTIGTVDDPKVETLKLPAQYKYCWHHVYDWTKNGRTGSEAKLSTNTSGETDGIIIKWWVAPPGFPCPAMGNGWIDNLWSVVGALPGESCPAQ
jgi:hypothetical protein